MSVHDPAPREPAGDDCLHRPPTNLAATGRLWDDVGTTSGRVTDAVGEIELGADTSQFVSAKPVDLEESSGAAARRFAGELERLLVGLSERGFYPAADGPLGTAAVDTALGAVDQMRYERRLLGASRMVLDRVAGSGPVAPSGMEAIRAEAADMAQRIVDEIGHPQTDEHALGPGLRARLARVERGREEALQDLQSVTAERDERLTLAESSRLAKRVDDLRAERDHIQRVAELCAAKSAAYLLWRNATAAALENLINAIEGHITDERAVRSIDLVAEAGRAREVLKVDAEETYGKDIPPPVKPAGDGPVINESPDAMAMRMLGRVTQERNRAEEQLTRLADFVMKYDGDTEGGHCVDVAVRVMLRQREELIKVRDELALTRGDLPVGSPEYVGEVWTPALLRNELLRVRADRDQLDDQVSRLGVFLMEHYSHEIRGDVDDTTAAGVVMRVMLRQREEREQAERDVARIRADHQRACEQIAAMYEAGTGRVGMPAVRGVVKDLADEHALRMACEEALGYSNRALDRACAEIAALGPALQWRTGRKPGDRVMDGGMMGTLVRCEKCGGDGLLHRPDELPETAAPQPEPREAQESTVGPVGPLVGRDFPADLPRMSYQRLDPPVPLPGGTVVVAVESSLTVDGMGAKATYVWHTEPGEPVVAGSKPLLRVVPDEPGAVADLSEISYAKVIRLGWRRVLTDVLAEHPAVSGRAADVVAFIAPLIVRLLEEQGRAAQLAVGKASDGPMTASFTGPASGPVRLLDGATGETLADLPTDGTVVPAPTLPGKNVTFLGGVFHEQMRRVPLVSGSLPRGLVCGDAPGGGRYALVHVADEEGSSFPVYVEAGYSGRIVLENVPDPVLATQIARVWDTRNPGCGIYPRRPASRLEQFQQRLEFTLRPNT